MIKICFITTVSRTLEAFYLDIAQSLHGTGKYDITFICDDDPVFERSLPNYITFIPVPMKRGINITDVLAIKRLYKIFKQENFDFVQYSTPNASLFASCAARLANVSHRVYAQWGIYYSGLSGIKRRFFKEIERKICSNSTYIEPDSYGNLYFSKKEGLYSSNKSGVVWNGSAIGVDLNRFNIEQKKKWNNEIRHKFNLEPQQLIVGFVGRITKDKGINELFSAMESVFQEIPEARLMLVGESENTKKLEENLWEWASNNSKVIFCGTTKEIEKYYAAMDILVLPSYREGFGMAVIEAEAMGVPVIVTNIPGPTEAMVHDETGLIVNKKNIEELSKAISYLLENLEESKEMGKKGRKFVENNFDRNTFMKELIKSREKILSSQDE